MTLDFSLPDVTITEFGVGRDDDDGVQTYKMIPVDAEVQAALREMAASTRAAMQELDDKPPRYQASEKYASSEYVHWPLDDDLAKLVRQLHQATNLLVDVTALSDPSTIFCYFARLADKQGHHLTALRRATQFKGVLKSRLIRLTTNALRIIEDTVFKLDSDFDLLVDGASVHILRPSGFEFLGGLRDAVLAATPQNHRCRSRCDGETVRHPGHRSLHLLSIRFGARGDACRCRGASRADPGCAGSGGTRHRAGPAKSGGSAPG